MDLQIKALTKTYHQQTVLDTLSFEKKDLKSLALIGASGSGKSTLLRLIAGLEGYDSGSLIINGHDLSKNALPSYRKKIGFVFQDHNLFPHLSIEENIYLVLEKVHHKNRKSVQPMVESLLQRFNLYEHKHKYPREISGGQSQRASIVRALSIEPELILLDEPTSSLDPVLTFEVLSAIQQLTETNTDFIIVTHEIGFAKHASDHVIFMENGHFIESGDASLFERPKTEALEHFLSKVLSYK